MTNNMLIATLTDAERATLNRIESLLNALTTAWRDAHEYNTEVIKPANDKTFELNARIEAALPRLEALLPRLEKLAAGDAA